MAVTGFGLSQRFLTEQEVETILVDSLAQFEIQGQRVLVIIPDSTRTMPLPLFFQLLCRHLLGKVKALDFMVALGTHPALSEEALLRLVGLSAAEKAEKYASVRLLNHAWNDPQALVALGALDASQLESITQGRLAKDVIVRINRAVLDYDHLLVCGPVFPHEVVGFSGGNKYFFPGIAGADVIHFTHWLGALLTSYEIIGVAQTPVRQVIDAAAMMIPRQRSALCAVVTNEGVAGLFGGAPEEAWAAAAKLSADWHIRWCEHPYHRVLSVLPEMYTEVWVGAKGMYKLEPVVADGGEVILYAPHIHEFSAVHGTLIRQVGYHVRDYFVKQWDKYKDIPWGVLAHSTHLRGIGMYEKGIETPRIQVTLATGIPAGDCAAVNLGYRDPASIDPQAWAGREDEGILLVPHAGEMLHRLKK
jgi:nickel-dependent lactate racemase